MPFIEYDRRAEINHVGDCNTPGELCFLAYRNMIARWRKDPRWTTAAEIYEDLTKLGPASAFKTAQELAWQVFFLMEVFPYELKKREENGDVEPQD